MTDNTRGATRHFLHFSDSPFVGTSESFAGVILGGGSGVVGETLTTLYDILDFDDDDNIDDDDVGGGGGGKEELDVVVEIELGCVLAVGLGCADDDDDDTGGLDVGLGSGLDCVICITVSGEL